MIIFALPALIIVYFLYTSRIPKRYINSVISILCAVYIIVIAIPKIASAYITLIKSQCVHKLTGKTSKKLSEITNEFADL